MADARDLKSLGGTRTGSSPVTSTTNGSLALLAKKYEAASLPHIFFALLARFLPRAVTGLSEIVTLTRFVAAATKRPLSAFAIPSLHCVSLLTSPVTSTTNGSLALLAKKYEAASLPHIFSLFGSLCRNSGIYFCHPKSRRNVCSSEYNIGVIFNVLNPCKFLTLSSTMYMCSKRSLKPSMHIL